MVVEEVEGFDISIFLGEGGRVGQLKRWGRLGLVGLQWWGGSCQGSRVGVLGAGGEEVGGGEGGVVDKATVSVVDTEAGWMGKGGWVCGVGAPTAEEVAEGI